MKQFERRAGELIQAGRAGSHTPRRGEELAAAPEKIPLAHYLWVLFRNRWTILAFVATCVGVTFFVSSHLTPVYEATAKVQIEQQTYFDANGVPRSHASGDADEMIATQMELIQSDGVLRPVVEHFSLQQRENHENTAEGKLKLRAKSNAPLALKQLKITRRKNTNLVCISYRATDPQLAADVANAIAQSYFRRSLDARLGPASQISDYTRQQLADLKSNSERSKLALSSFEKKHDTGNLEAQIGALAGRIAELNATYASLHADRIRKEALYNQLEANGAAVIGVSAQWEELNRANDKLEEAKRRLAKIGATYAASRPEYRQAANSVAQATRHLSDVRRTLTQRAARDYHAALAREDGTEKVLMQAKKQYDEAMAQLAEYRQLKRNAETDQAIFSDFERGVTHISSADGLPLTSVRIADAARPASRPAFPDMKLNLLVAFVLSFFIAMIGVLARYAVDNTMRDPEDTARALRTNVIGTLPKSKQLRILPGPITHSLMPAPSSAASNGTRDGASLVRYAGNGLTNGTPHPFNGGELSASPGLERGEVDCYKNAVRILSRSALLPEVDRNVRSLLITSAGPGEGKSTTAIHLAIAYAEQGTKTLLVDADLRRPSLQFKLNLNARNGLANAVLGEVTCKETIIKSGRWPNLDIMPAGMGSRRSSDLLGSVLADILDDAANEYDFTFVDGPPLLGSNEATGLATAVDGVIVIVRAGKTRRKAVATALAKLKRLHANVIGLVLNETDEDTPEGYYYTDYRKDFVEKLAQAN